MSTLTLGKLRGLQQISTERGIFTITALDHRGSFARMVRAALGVTEIAWETVVEVKEQMVRTLAPHSSAILLDPVYGVGPLVAGVLPGNVGLLFAREQSGYTSDGSGRLTTLEAGWSVAAIKRLGASAVKLLIYYHPDDPSAPHQEEVVKKVAQECREHDILFLLEPMSYSIEAGVKKNSPEFAAQKPEIVLESARRLVPLGVDVLKAEFPTDPNEPDEGKMRAYCRQLTDMIGIPWVLLSAGVDFVTFQRQVEIACEEGASGFLAGRAIWKECMGMVGEERNHFLNTIAISRLRILADIAQYRGTPWQKRMTAYSIPQAKDGWHQSYDERGIV